MSAIAPRPKYDSVKFTMVGDTVTGTILEFEDVQMTVFNSSPPIPRFWDEAKVRPMLQTKVVLEVPGRTAPVALWVKPGNMMNAVRDAVIKAGAKDVEVDGIINVTFTGTEPSKGGGQDAKTYTAVYEAPFDPTA
jgi:hypothetical protein